MNPSAFASRREFLIKSGALASAALALPATDLFGGQRRPARWPVASFSKVHQELKLDFEETAAVAVLGPVAPAPINDCRKIAWVTVFTVTGGPGAMTIGAVKDVTASARCEVINVDVPATAFTDGAVFIADALITPPSRAPTDATFA